jgi:hypothetical protein
MDKIKIKYAIDIGLLIAALLNFLTGIIKFPLLTNYFKSVSTIISWYTLSNIHDWSGITIVLLVVTHLIFNWSWIVAMTKSMFKKKEPK